jgi:hypothetical protein
MMLENALIPVVHNPQNSMLDWVAVQEMIKGGIAYSRLIKELLAKNLCLS